MPTEHHPTHPRPTSVYRYYDSNDLLLYVGITSRGARRQDEHNAAKEWWHFVARQEVEHYPSRPAAIDRERGLIRSYGPPFNIQHNPGHEVAREAYLALATKDGTKVRNIYPALMSRAGKTRLAMEVEQIGNTLILRTEAEDGSIVNRIDPDDREKLITAFQGAAGARPQLSAIRVQDGRLIAHVRCRKRAEECVAASVMLRMPDGKKRKHLTIKRIDLYSLGQVV